MSNREASGQVDPLEQRAQGAQGAQGAQVFMDPLGIQLAVGTLRGEQVRVGSWELELQSLR